MCAGSGHGHARLRPGTGRPCFRPLRPDRPAGCQRRARNTGLLGVITSDDIIDVIQEEAAEDVAHMSGSDAQELENKSPAQVARLRLPWIMATLFIELLAGLRHSRLRCDAHEVYSAGLVHADHFRHLRQHGLAVRRHHHSRPIHRTRSACALETCRARQMATTAILGGACALTLGLIGGDLGPALGVRPGRVPGHVPRRQHRGHRRHDRSPAFQAGGLRPRAHGGAVRDRLSGRGRHQHLPESGRLSCSTGCGENNTNTSCKHNGRDRKIQ